MARRAIFRNHLLPIAAAVTIIGMVPTAVAFLVVDYSGPQAEPDWYAQIIPSSGWNTWVQIVAPIVLFTGIWYLAEQIVLRRRFHKLIDQPKRSELQKNMSEIEDTLGRLPKAFEREVEAKEASFKSKR